MPDEATPQVAAPAPAEQPAPQAPAVESAPVETQAAPVAEAPATAAPVVESDELTTLRQRYKSSSDEALRLYRENEALKSQKPTAPPPAAAPTYSPEQLETWKEQWYVKATKEPDKAEEAAHQIRLIDAELRKTELNQFAGRQSASQAYEKLKADVQPILETYKNDLTPGTPLYNSAQEIHRQAVASGMADNEMTATSSILLALAKSGKFAQGVATKAASQATDNLNKALKSAAAAGSGAANQNASPQKDFRTMSKTEFHAYRKGLGVVN